MRHLAWLCALGSLALASGVEADPWAAPTWRPPAAAEIRCPPEQVLPAGVYHRGIGWYDFHLDGCPAPAVAVVAGVYPNAALARRAARAPRRGLAPGYPWVVHTRAAGLAEDGIAVVLAQWATAEQGAAWIADHAPGAHLVEVLGQEEALARFEADHGGRSSSPIPEVVYVQSATPAYSATDARAIADAPPSDQSLRGEARFESAWRASQRRRARAQPLCRVPARTVHTFASDEAVRTTASVWSRSWQPVRCGRRIAWVPVEATQQTAVTWRHVDGDARVTRVTLVECDTPTYTTWRVRDDEEREPRALRGSCGR